MSNLKDPYSILYIDGNDVRKKQFSSRLRMQTFTVELALGGFHALHQIEKFPFDLILIQGDDLEDMPAEEVVGLIRSIHSRNELPILTVLSEPDDELAHALAEAGVNKIIISDGNFNHILQEIKKIELQHTKKK